jgi:surface antigen
MVQLTPSDERGDLAGRHCRRPLRLSAACLIAAALAGCAVSVPLPSFMNSDTTGAIKPRASPLSADLDDADWRIAEPVLATALKTEQGGQPAAWANPTSGHGGAFQPVAGAFKRDGQTCRAFVARINAADQSKIVQAIGCLAAGDAVFVDQAQPWKAL